MIYPEWLEARDSWAASKWVVRQVRFKGFYEELLLENAGVTLRVLNGQAGKFIEGSKVKIKIGRYLEY
jgi:hypothetical protein